MVCSVLLVLSIIEWLRERGLQLVCVDRLFTMSILSEMVSFKGGSVDICRLDVHIFFFSLLYP